MNPHSLELTAQMARQAALRTLQAAESATEAAAQAYRAYADGLLYTPDPWDVADDDPRITDAVFGMFAASSACSDCRQAIETISKEHKYGRQEEPKTTKHG